MNWEREEDERIDAEIAAEDWCVLCDVPIGHGWCWGCIAAGEHVEDLEPDEDAD